MLDSYVYGIHERMSPEAPVPVVDVEHREERLGGAANVALNLKSLGAKVSLMSLIGMEAAGQRLLDLLSLRGVHSSDLIQSDSRKTTIKHRVIANDKHLLRIDEEQIEDILPSEEADLLNRLEAALREGRFQGVIFQDYNKGVLTKGFIEKGLELCRKYKVFSAVDPKKKNFLEYREADLFKPNLKEIIQGLKWKEEVKTEEELSHLSQDLMSRIGCKNLLLTLSERGILFNNAESEGILPAMQRNIVDVSGAGDTVLAVACACLCAGSDIKTAAYLSNMAGGLVCEQVGVVPIDRELLIQSIRQSN